MTLAELLISLRNRLRTAIEQDDRKTCGALMTAFVQMIEVSYGGGNENLIGLLEDMRYAAQHVFVPFKAVDAIPTDEQIMAVFTSDDIDKANLADH